MTDAMILLLMLLRFGGAALVLVAPSIFGLSVPYALHLLRWGERRQAVALLLRAVGLPLLLASVGAAACYVSFNPGLLG